MPCHVATGYIFPHNVQYSTVIPCVCGEEKIVRHVRSLVLPELCYELA